MSRLLPFMLALSPFFSLAQTPVQTLRGSVADAATLRPLAGATVLLTPTDPPLGAVTGASGQFVLGKVPVGRYRLQASYLGYETLTIAEILVEAGHETVQEIQLQERPEALGEVTVQAQGRGSLGNHPVGLRTLTVEQQFRFPATFFDPARVAAAYPGVAAPDDQANHLSIRGNSPNAVRWRLAGADIVNPNHTANAGTFSDRPSTAGGGVNILSAQVLGVSNFLTGAFPSGFGDAIGGVLDMHFRKGNDRHREYTAQAGLIGLEVALEGPFLQLGSSQSDSSAVRAQLSSPGSRTAELPNCRTAKSTYLVNYRYSFTGLLAALGVNFGGEEISFQDLSFHLDFPSEKAGEFGVFGLGGLSGNFFRPPSDPSEITEDKQRFDIDFRSKMGAIGITHVLPIGKKTVLRSVVALSALSHGRTADRVALTPAPRRWDDDDFTERKLAASSVFSQKISARSQLRLGLQAVQEHTRFSSFADDNFGGSTLAGTTDGWLFQPFSEWALRLSAKWEAVAGLHAMVFFGPPKNHLKPRASLRFSPSGKTSFSLAYGLHVQRQLPQVYQLSAGRHGLAPTRSHHLVFGFRQNMLKHIELTAEAYYQHLFDVPVSTAEGSKFSAVNLLEFAGFEGETLVNRGTARNYGLDVSLERFWGKGGFGLLSGSLYRSLFTATDGVERPTRWDGRYLVGLTSGREKSKQKNGKTRVRGTSLHLTWRGGFRERPIDPAASAARGRTAFQTNAAYTERLDNFSRLDWRFYLKWERPERSSMLSLDIQNLLNEQNQAYHYFDQVKGRVVSRRQLGIIPVASWRVGF